MKVVLFDLDGTLIDSSEGITKSCQHTMKHYGMEETDLNSFRRFIGPPLSESFMNFYGFSEEKALEAVRIYRERYNTIGLFECCLYPGVKECLQALKAAGYLISVASSKPEETCKRMLTHFGIIDLFDEVVGATMDGRINTKEQVLREVLRRFANVSIADMVLVGDTIFDVEGANSVGIASIGVSFGFGKTEEMQRAGALCICDSFSEVTDYFMEKEV